MIQPIRVVPQPPRRVRDKDGLHKRRGIWHYKLKIGGKWREVSTGKRNFGEARKVRLQALQDQEAGRLPNDLAKLHFEKATAIWLAGRQQLVAPENIPHREGKVGSANRRVQWYPPV